MDKTKSKGKQEGSLAGNAGVKMKNFFEKKK